MMKKKMVMKMRNVDVLRIFRVVDSGQSDRCGQKTNEEGTMVKIMRVFVACLIRLLFSLRSL